ncbi:hypothetical protein Ari01nite_20990 [Paractinoplanes rishiriensis]|uniref:Glycoside hydrolase family 127 protein n=2 Tax=Paractinoplanes rishiriensis TaxID=1050105 RepID=A0A919JW28_9ACTN|nr:hypothetical protein Ari01nite_20990 [Actinoplanes rishiriensis]
MNGAHLPGPAAPTPSALAALHPLPLAAVRLTPDGLLGRWQDRNATATLPHCIDQLDVQGNLTNLRRVTGDSDAEYRNMWFADTDVYKTLEAAAWEIGRTGGGFAEFLTDVAALLEKAQDADGYLDSYYQVDRREQQWTDLGFSHEMYSAGHLIQAAVAAYRATGSAQLLGVARRFADLLVTRFGPAGADVVDGHPEVETALVELYRLTGHEPYLAQAKRSLELRGHRRLGEGRFGPRYWQDDQPLRDAREVMGHAVRQQYLLAGAVDVAVETGDAGLLATAERLFTEALAHKTYLTGGQGSRHKDEGFGDPYELPPDRAYAETCAAIGSFHTAWRLLLATGHAKYADEMERVLYNGIAGSTAVDGRAFFYSNPLQLRTGHDGSHEDTPSQRLSWYSCACCPPNLARLMASLHTYAATGDDDGLQVHLYADGSITAGGYQLAVRTDYPWDERITLTVTAAGGPGPWTLALRVPSWCRDARLSVNGSVVRTGAQEGYLRLNRTWKAGDRVELTLAMPARIVAAHPRVDAVRGSVALARGPVVYCLEHADLPPHLSGTLFEDLELDLSRPLELGTGTLAPVTIRVPVLVRDDADGSLYRPYPPSAVGDGRAATVPAIPYFLWANRAAGPMRVWIPVAATR